MQSLNDHFLFLLSDFIFRRVMCVHHYDGVDDDGVLTAGADDNSKSLPKLFFSSHNILSPIV